MSFRRFLVSLVVLGFLIGVGAGRVEASEYASPKLDQDHAFQSVIPQESVDLFNGALVLSYRDVHIPGPGGMDLDVIRWYNSKIFQFTDPSCIGVSAEETSLGIGWQFHQGRLWKNFVTGANPRYRLELPGGGIHEFYSQPTISIPGGGTLISKTYWILQENQSIGGTIYHVVTSPSGMQYLFDPSKLYGLAQGANYYYLAKKVDPAGNAITVTYEASGDPYISTVSDSLGRTATFIYRTTSLNDPKPLDRIRVKNTQGVNVDFVYEVGGENGGTLGTSGHQGLLSVTTPMGLRTSYTYDLRPGEVSREVELKSMTLPTGQVIEYYYQDHDFYNPFMVSLTHECTRVVDKKVLVGIGTWDYGKPGDMNDWPEGRGTDNVTVVRDPLGHEERSTFERYATSGNDRIWKIGLITRWEVVDPTDGTLRTEDYSYSNIQVSSVNISPTAGYNETLRAARRDSRTVTVRGGGASKVSKTAYENYDSYGNQGTIKEFGYPSGTTLLRQTDTTYAHGAGGQWLPANRYVVDRPARVKVLKPDGVTIRKDTKYTYYLTNTPPAALYSLQREERWADKLSDFSTTSKWLQTDYEYDDNGDRTRRTFLSSSGNRVTTFTYNNGNLATMTDGEGLVFSRGINQHTGLVTSETDANGNATTYAYDDLGRLTQIHTPVGADTAIDYDDVTAKAVVVTRDLSETRYEYDGLGRRTLTRRQVGPGSYAYERVDYDTVGQIAKAYEADFVLPVPAGAGTTFTYDALGRVKTRQDPFGTTTNAYGPDTVNITYPVSGTKTLTYDAIGRLVTVLDEANKTTSYTYDVNDNVEKVVAPTGTNVADRVITFSSLRWVLREQFPESGTARYEYNDFGELTRRDDAQGRRADTAYDARGRITTMTHAGAPVVTYYYDGDPMNGLSGPYLNPLGNRTGMSDGSILVQWRDYDALNRPKVRRTKVEGQIFTETLGYDVRGNLQDRKYPRLESDPGERLDLDVTSNRANRIDTILANSATIVSGVTYNAALRPRDIPLGNGATIQRPTSPALRNRPDLIRSVGALDAAGSNADRVLDYSYDARGRVDSIRTDGRLDDYAYDPRDQLQSVAFGTEGSVSYSYDNTGNITQVSSVAFPQQNFTRTHNNNRIVGFGYDLSGRLLSDGVNTYTYDQAGRLATAPTTQGAKSFLYDGEGRRRVDVKPDGSKEVLFYGETGELLSKFSIAPGGTPQPVEDVIYLDGERIATRRYPELSHPGNTLVADLVGNDVRLDWGPTACLGKVDVLRSASSLFVPSSTLAAGLYSQTYTDAGEGAGPQSQYYVIAGAQPSLHFHVNDHLGSTRMVLNEDRKVEATYDYFPYGALKSGSCNSLSGGFQGKERDEDTGLDDYGIRHYSATLARFLTPDPDGASIDPTRPHSWNRYLYNMNNPMQFVDPDGGSWRTSWVGQAVSMGVGFIPVVGDLYDLSTAVFGVDFITGQKLSNTERILALGAAIPVFGAAVGGAKFATKGVEAAIENKGVRHALTEAIENVTARGSRGALDAAAEAASGGRLGKQSTREQVRALADELERLGFEITGGGGRKAEEYLPGLGGGRKGSNWVDLTVKKDGQILRINTVDTLADGITSTKREARAADSIRAKIGNDPILVPKPKAPKKK